MSDATRLKIDQAQQEITDLAYERAAAMVVDNRPLLETLATTLLANEVLDRGDIERMVGEHRSPPSFEEALGRAGLTAAERLDRPPGA